jgi:hypothetical protein
VASTLMTSALDFAQAYGPAGVETPRCHVMSLSSVMQTPYFRNGRPSEYDKRAESWLFRALISEALRPVKRSNLRNTLQSKAPHKQAS